MAAVAEQLRGEGLAVRCVSMPSWDLFDAQPQAYIDSVLPPAAKARLAVELGVAQGWHRWVGDAGDIVSIDRYGASAPLDVLLEHYGFTVDAVAERARRLLARVGRDA